MRLVEIELGATATQVLGVLAREHAAVGAVHLLRHVSHREAAPFGQIELSAAFLVRVFTAQISSFN